MESRNNEIETKLGVWGNNVYGQLTVDSENEMQIIVPKLISF